MADDREPIEAQLDELCADLTDAELRVLVLLAQRLVKGHASYGALRVASDARVWRSELREELLDALVYRAIGDVAGERWGAMQALTEVQARCSELLDEVRALRASAGAETRGA